MPYPITIAGETGRALRERIANSPYLVTSFLTQTEQGAV